MALHPPFTAPEQLHQTAVTTSMGIVGATIPGRWQEREQQKPSGEHVASRGGISYVVGTSHDEPVLMYPKKTLDKMLAAARDKGRRQSEARIKDLETMLERTETFLLKHNDDGSAAPYLVDIDSLLDDDTWRNASIDAPAAAPDRTSRLDAAIRTEAQPDAPMNYVVTQAQLDALLKAHDAITDALAMIVGANTLKGWDGK